jgi:hypothetical protein
VVSNGTLYIVDESRNLSAFVAPSAAAPAMPGGAIWIAAGLMLGIGLAVTNRRPWLRARLRTTG